MELAYWAVTRLVLIYYYQKAISNLNRPAYHSPMVHTAHTIATILPCEMLIFFGYHKKKSNDFTEALLNLSWLRRIVSLLRISVLLMVQVMAANVSISDDFISMVYLFQTVYLAMLMIAVCPQPSTYDAQSWYT